MKRIVCTMLVCLLVAGMAGCGKTAENGKKIESVNDVKMSIVLSSGETRTGKYTGETVEGKMHGAGNFTTTNAEGETWTYEGQFKEGVFDGKGKMTWEDGERVEEGTFKNENLEGDGIIHIEGIISEEGAYKGGQLNGHGKVYDDSGKLMYEGEFDMGRPAIKPIGLNQKAHFADWEYECTKVEAHTSIGESSTQEKYVVYLINCKNNSKSTRSIGDFFMLEDNNGRTYEMDSDASLEYNYAFNTKNWHLDETGASLTSIDVPFAFEVPKDAKGFRLLPTEAYYTEVPAIEVEIAK